MIIVVMKEIKMKRISTIACIILLAANFASAEAESYQKIKIESVFSKLVTRDNTDRVYSGQIKSEAGLAEF